MSLFDDDFFSTRVSRRTRRSGMGQPSWNGTFRSRRKLGPVQLAFLSSFASAVAAVLIFGVVFGFGGGEGGTHSASGGAAAIDPSERVIDAAAKVGPAVVSIINEQMLPAGGSGLDGDSGDSGDDGSDQGDDGGGPDGSDGSGDGSGSDNGGGSGADTDGNTLQEAGLGSGVIIGRVNGKDRIITNFHVVDGAYALKAVLSNGETRDAKLIGKDKITDLAVLEIAGKASDTVAKIGDSRKLRGGETVLAIGNPLGLGDSLTAGIVSKTSRVIPVSLNQDGVIDWEQEVIQIDASINQGNSGGALVNLNGELVGINSMKVAEYGVEGLGFAIPIDNALPVIDSLIKYGKVKRPYLGVYTMDLSQYLAQRDGNLGLGDNGTIVPGDGDPDTDSGSGDSGDSGDDEPDPNIQLPKSVTDGVIVLEAVGPASDAGLKLNDVIVKLDNTPVGSTMELRKYLYTKKKIGDKIVVTFYRDGKKQSVSFGLIEKTDG